MDAKPVACLTTEVTDDRLAPSGNALHKTKCETKPNLENINVPS